MISRVIHQMTGELRDAERWAAFSEKTRALHPNWSYRLWSEEECRLLVADHEPSLLPAYDLFRHNLMRADLARMIILREFGGLYLDLDYEMLRPFDLLRHRLVLPKNRSRRMGDRADSLGNCVIAAEPGHTFWDLALERLRRRPPLGLSADRQTATGNRFLTRVHAEEVRGRPIESSIATPERPLFHPPTPHSDEEYRSIVDEGVAYGIHHCDRTTNRRKFPRRVKSIIRSLLPIYA